MSFAPNVKILIPQLTIKQEYLSQNYVPKYTRQKNIFTFEELFACKMNDIKKTFNFQTNGLCKEILYMNHKTLKRAHDYWIPIYWYFHS